MYLWKQYLIDFYLRIELSRVEKLHSTQSILIFKLILSKPNFDFDFRKVLREKRRKLVETWNRVIQMYEKEDPEQYADLKKVWNNYQGTLIIDQGHVVFRQIVRSLKLTNK